MKPQNSNNCPRNLSISAKKAKMPLLTPIVILLLLAGFARFESKTLAAGKNPLAKAAQTQNQAAVADMLEKNKPATVDWDAWKNPQEHPPRFALTKEQLQLFEKIYSLNTKAASTNALRQLSGSSRANSLMIGMNSYWTPAFDNLQLRAPGHSSARLNRGSAWRPTHAYPSVTMYEMYGPGEYMVSESLSPDSVYPQYHNSTDEPKRFIDFNDFIDSGDFGESGAQIYYDGEPVEVDGETLYVYFGQCPRAMEPVHLWFTPYYLGSNVRGDWNSDPYNISRTGVMFGGHINLGRHSAFGMVIGYSDPVLTQYHARYTANDYHIGFYGGTYINCMYELKGYLGFGFQEYTTRRTADFTGVNQSVAGRTAGSNFAMSFEFARPLDDGSGGLWRPYLALDLNNVHQDGYREYGDAFALQYGDASLTKTFFRLGVNREINRGHWKVRGGLGYSTQLGGQSAPASFERLAGTSWGITEYGVDTARDFVHGNVGLEYFLNCRRTTSLFSDYNVRASRRETDYFVTVGLKWLL